MIRNDGIFPFLGTPIPTATVYSCILISQKLRNYGDIVYIGAGTLDGVNQTAVFAHADMCFITKVRRIRFFIDMPKDLVSIPFSCWM